MQKIEVLGFCLSAARPAQRLISLLQSHRADLLFISLPKDAGKWEGASRPSPRFRCILGQDVLQDSPEGFGLHSGRIQIVLGRVNEIVMPKVVATANQ